MRFNFKTIKFTVLMLLATFQGLTLEASEDSGWAFFGDGGRAYKTMRADQREAQFRMQFVNTQNQGKFWDIVFGGDLGLLSYTKDKDHYLSLTVRGLSSARFKFQSESFNQHNTDYIGGLALGYRFGKMSTEAHLYHQSSHLGDEVQELGRQRIDYSRETFRWMLDYTQNGYRIYGGASHINRADPGELEGKFWGQLGLEKYFMVYSLPCFVVLDLQSREEHSWHINHNVQLGFDMGDWRRVIKRQRFVLEYYNGYSHMGQFYNTKEQNLSFGIGFDF
ncbi:MAG: DUF1207 domain-containing protein [Planctomycetes bacterium]|nr:DUF1207 domain-containing protein [Planctomycetota bacterium]